MFKKTKIAAVSAAVLGLSSMTAQAVSVSETGSGGEVLIFPYYNVNNGYVTAYNITNTTGDYKAVKIRFRESENSNDVLDFNLYLSPKDVFTMSLKKGSDEGVSLATSDNTCTHPKIPEDGVLFRHNAYDSTGVEDVREGYLEVIEMGVIDEDAYVLINKAGDDVAENQQKITTEGILHEDGMPIDCSVIEAAWQQGVFMQGGAIANDSLDSDVVDPKSPGYKVQNVDSDTKAYGQATSNGLDSDDELTDQTNVITQPTGGLVGSSILVDTINITGYVAEPVAIADYSSVAQHYLSSDENFYLLPSLASGSATNGFNTVVRDWGLDDKNVLPRTSVPSGINPMAITAELLISTLGNQYFLQGDTLTDWVVSAPMRKHGIYNDYKYMATNAQYTDDGFDIPVDGDIGDNKDSVGAYWQFQDEEDVNASFVYYDREEGEVVPDGGDFSPPLATGAQVPFEREVNILTLNTGSAAASVLGSDNAQSVTLDPGFVDGWGVFDFSGDSTYNLGGDRYAAWGANASGKGVPLIGFMAARATLGSQKVGETFPHFVGRDSSYFD